MLLTAFAVFVALALCGYRAAFGPQKRLACVGLGFGASATSFLGLAYPAGQSAWLLASYVSGALMLVAVAILVLTSLRHWWATPDAAFGESPHK